MDIKREDLPVTLQAFELENNHETFIAEQFVNTQADVDKFTSLYAGKIIKASKATVQNNNHSAAVSKKRNPATGMIMIVIILVLLALIIYGFSTGWIQEKFNLNI
ncbi:MAG: hypothetical protein H7X88_07770 [Gloeobacteraceae cyanobacterium ES-bin-316]|nr:hypothetical protein [Ferruginibacter sp.]